jgi:transposase InsO family protein
MTSTKRFPPEVRERAVRLVVDQEREHNSQWACIEAIAPKIGCAPQTLRAWVKQAEVDEGRVDGVTTSDRGSQYLSKCYTERLAEAGFEPSVGSKGDSYDNAMTESVIGLYKTEVIKHQGPLRTFESVEYASLVWMDWYNQKRLHSAIDYLSPAAFEAA